MSYNPLSLESISRELNSQDNRCTTEPMFCVQILRRDVGYDVAYASHTCWHDSSNDVTVYDDDPEFKEPTGSEWEQFGYTDRWETVMVAFTEAGCLDYLQRDGHNVQRRAFRGQVRIYAESFNRCLEMITIRESLQSNRLHKVSELLSTVLRTLRMYSKAGTITPQGSMLQAEFLQSLDAWDQQQNDLLRR